MNLIWLLIMILTPISFTFNLKNLIARRKPKLFLIPIGLIPSKYTIGSINNILICIPLQIWYWYLESIDTIHMIYMYVYYLIYPTTFCNVILLFTSYWTISAAYLTFIKRYKRERTIWYFCAELSVLQKRFYGVLQYLV